jgi:hypothetical protein
MDLAHMTTERLYDERRRQAGQSLNPTARTIIDVGAEEARAVRCDERGVMADFVLTNVAPRSWRIYRSEGPRIEVKLETWVRFRLSLTCKPNQRVMYHIRESMSYH